MERTTTNYAYKNGAIGSTEKVFQEIHLKSKNIAIQQRDITFLKGELTALISQRVECRTNGTIPEILADLKDYFAQNLPEYSNLLTDVSSILKAFAKTTGATSLRLLLATVDSGMCRKFHTDINDLRLLCTYIGPGTLWLPDEAINYSA